MADVVMPQMGESIVEGTLTKWLKKVGDRVERDEPLFEISTDKVDTEIPAPAAGTLTEILAQEGETVQVNAVVARIGDGDGAGRKRRRLRSRRRPRRTSPRRRLRRKSPRKSRWRRRLQRQRKRSWPVRCPRWYAGWPGRTI
jgi:pyruvate/2-oxoglutarate dehydrogenase complex dihydrolipoamide acyltransferase (E2) component